MRYRSSLLFLLLCVAGFVPAPAQTSLIATFTLFTDAGDSMRVCAGIAPGATPFPDTSLGEMEIPPPPPDGVFDLRFVDPDTLRHALGEGSWSDIRAGDPLAASMQQHLLLCRPGGATAIGVAWDLPPGVAALLDRGSVSPSYRIFATGKGTAPLGEGGPVIGVQITLHMNVRVLAMRAMLEGAFDARTKTMRTSLLDRGVLRVHFPGRTLPQDAVDSVGIEVPDAGGGPGAEEPIVQPAWIRADGTICPFTPPFDLPIIVPDPFRPARSPVIHHRNHVSAACARVIPAGVTAAFFDMTSGPDMYAGGNAAYLAAGLWGLIAGDADGDGRIGTWDRAAVRAAIGEARVYVRGDMDLNGGVGATDLALVRRNIGSPVKEP